MAIAKIFLFSTLLYGLQWQVASFQVVGQLLSLIAVPIILSTFTWSLISCLHHFLHVWMGEKLQGEGKVVMITGCDTGFGHEIALKMNQEGFTVFAGCLDLEGANAQRLLTCCFNRSKMNLISFNVTKEQDIDRTLETVQKHYLKTNESLHTIVLNAGVTGLGCTEWGAYQMDCTPVFSINLLANLKITRKFVPELVKSHNSRIIYMSSYITKCATPYVGTYAMSKWGIHSMVKTFRDEVEKDPSYYKNLQVVEVKPVVYRTGMLGYEAVLNTFNNTWSRSTNVTKEDYGQRMFDAIITFLNTVHIFEYFDFLTLKRNLHEVSDVVYDAAVSAKPEAEYKLIGWYLHSVVNCFNHVMPADFLELYFDTITLVTWYYGLQMMVLQKAWSLLVESARTI